jgi:hypothetical protein
MAKGLILDAPTLGSAARLVEGFAQQLGGQVERVSGSQGTTGRLILPAREQPLSAKRE